MDRQDSAVGHWYTESWTKWRIIECWARGGVGAVWAGLILILSMMVSKEFTILALYTGMALLAIDVCTPPRGGSSG